MIFYKIKLPNKHESLTVHELLLKNSTSENSMLSIANAKTIVILKDELRKPINLMDYDIYLHCDDNNRANCSSSLCRIANTNQGILEINLNHFSNQCTNSCLTVHLCHANLKHYCVQLNINPLAHA